MKAFISLIDTYSVCSMNMTLDMRLVTANFVPFNFSCVSPGNVDIVSIPTPRKNIGNSGRWGIIKVKLSKARWVGAINEESFHGRGVNILLNSTFNLGA